MGDFFRPGFPTRQRAGNEGWLNMEPNGLDTFFLVVVLYTRPRPLRLWKNR